MKLIGKIFFPTCLTISVLLLFYTFYKSEIHWGGDKRDYYLIYYLISGILIIFSIITFYLNEKIKTYLIITLTSIVLTLYAFEGYLIYEERNWELTKKVKLYKEQTGKKYDTRIRFEVYEDLKKNDENIVVSIKPKLYLEDNADFFKIPLKKGQKKIF